MLNERELDPFFKEFYFENSINEWKKKFEKIQIQYPNFFQQIKIILDRSPYNRKIFQISVPQFYSKTSKDVVLRFIGAWINNAVMTWGCHHLFIDDKIYTDILVILEKRYWQIIQVMKDNYGDNCGISQLSLIDCNKTVKKHYVKINTHMRIKDKIIAGIDIGNTSTKVAIIKDGKIVFKDRIKTFDNGISFSSLKSTFLKAHKKVMSFSKAIHSIGVGWFGDVRDGKPLLQAADLQIIAKLEGENTFTSWFNEILIQNNIPIRIYGDSEALGKSLPFLWPKPNLYLMILGTSIGGAYINEDYEFDHSFNLLSRIIINMSDTSLPHASTKVKGVLQQYIASRGIKRAIEIMGKKYNYMWLFENISKSESGGEFLNSLIESNDINKNKIGNEIVVLLSSYIVEAIMALTEFYKIKTFGLTGTSLQGKIGEYIIKNIEQFLKNSYNKTDIKVRIAPFDLSYGGAISAAYCAANDTIREFY